MEIYLAGERAMLEGMLDRQRDELVGILADLDDTAARVRLVPSLTTPLALVKHAMFAETIWFQSRVAGVPRADLGLPDSIDETFVLTPEDTVDSIREAFLLACDRSRTIAAEHDLDEQFPWHQGPVTLRFIYTHMIAELARHAGHGDILVEQLKDGARQTASDSVSTRP
ncbi:MAG TPA: DinB family protein [Sporichthya sp.]|nr:DinB family protein [Sporichthya sp.]